MLYLRGIKVFTLAKGKPLSEQIPELILAPALVLWSVQTASTALGVGLIPAAMFWRSGVVSSFIAATKRRDTSQNTD